MATSQQTMAQEREARLARKALLAQLQIEIPKINHQPLLEGSVQFQIKHDKIQCNIDVYRYLCFIMKSYDGLRPSMLSDYLIERFPNLKSYESAPQIEETIQTIIKDYTDPETRLVTQEKFCALMQAPTRATPEEIEAGAFSEDKIWENFQQKLFWNVNNGLCEKDEVTKVRRPIEQLTPEAMKQFFDNNKFGQQCTLQQLKSFYDRYLGDMKTMDFETFMKFMNQDLPDCDSYKQANAQRLSTMKKGKMMGGMGKLLKQNTLLLLKEDQRKDF